MSPYGRREMIRKDNTNLSLTRQFELLKVYRSSIYYTPVGYDRNRSIVASRGSTQAA